MTDQPSDSPEPTITSAEAKRLARQALGLQPHQTSELSRIVASAVSPDFRAAMARASDQGRLVAAPGIDRLHERLLAIMTPAVAAQSAEIARTATRLSQSVAPQVLAAFSGTGQITAEVEIVGAGHQGDSSDPETALDEGSLADLARPGDLALLLALYPAVLDAIRGNASLAEMSSAALAVLAMWFCLLLVREIRGPK